jgi:hypothetical protein
MATQHVLGLLPQAMAATEALGLSAAGKPSAMGNLLLLFDET